MKRAMNTTPALPPIPISDVAADWAPFAEEAERVFQRLILSGRFVLGPEVERFEADFAAYLGADYAIGVSSGSDALLLTLQALGLGPGDEVVTTSLTFVATVEAICRVGAQPVFADICPKTLNVDAAAVAAAMSPRTKCILAVHLFGRPAPLPELAHLAQRHGVALVEDVAQATGAELEGRRLGTWGVAGAFSFFPTKNLGAMGDGGAVVTRDAALARRVQGLRQHGLDTHGRAVFRGQNARLDALQGALLRLKLPHLDASNQARRTMAARYQAALTGLPGLELPEACPGHVFHHFPCRLPPQWRDDVVADMQAGAIDVRAYYRTPVHLMPAYAQQVHLPCAEAAAAQILCLPLWATMPVTAVERVTQRLAQSLQRQQRKPSP